MGILYSLFGAIMRFCCSISANNYIIALFFFTLIMQVILFPFGIKQQKNSVKTANLRPKEQAIRKKYAGRTDKVTQQKMNMEIQEMYQKEGYNPMSGCLPLLIQFPVLIILYAIVRLPLSYSTSEEKIPQSVRKELVEQSVIVANSQKEVAVILGEENSTEYNEAEGVLNAAQTGEESKLVKSLKYDSTAFINEKMNGGYEGLAKENYNAYLQVTQKFGNYVSFYAPVLSKNSEAEGEEVVKVQKEQISPDELSSANTLEMCSFSYDASLMKNSVENKLGYDRIKRTADIDVESDLPDFKFIGGTTLLDIPNISEFSPILLVPVLVFITSLVGSEITRRFSAPAPAADGQNPGNNWFLRFGMPLFSTVLTFSFFAALGIYWAIRSVLSAVQQIILSKIYPIPTFSKEELKAAEEEILSKRKRKKIIMIEVDEDDTSYDSLIISEEKAEKIRKRHEKKMDEAKANNGGAKNEERKFIDRAPLKKDKDDEDDSEVK